MKEKKNKKMEINVFTQSTQKKHINYTKVGYNNNTGYYIPVLGRKIEYGGKNPVSFCSIAHGQAVSNERSKNQTKGENKR